MLEDSRMYMNRMNSPVTPPVTLSYETPAQPTPSIMNELEDAIITDLQVFKESLSYHCFLFWLGFQFLHFGGFT